VGVSTKTKREVVAKTFGIDLDPEGMRPGRYSGRCPMLRSNRHAQRRQGRQTARHETVEAL
jgi:hypothetical protein